MIIFSVGFSFRGVVNLATPEVLELVLYLPAR